MHMRRKQGVSKGGYPLCSGASNRGERHPCWQSALVSLRFYQRGECIEILGVHTDILNVKLIGMAKQIRSISRDNYIFCN